MSSEPPARPGAIFIDDGGVLSDNRLRAPEWLRLIGEFMPPRLGGAVERWTAANRVVAPQVQGDLWKRLPDYESHREFYRDYATAWMHAMCDGVGIARLPDADAVSLYTELACYVGERASCAVPGAADAVLALRAAGYAVYTASGTPSWELRGITANMGLAGVFITLYGPDLADHVKHGPAFYEKIFAHAGVSAASAMVIESDAECCGWASAAGATTVWVDRDGKGDVPSLAGLVLSAAGLGR